MNLDDVKPGVGKPGVAVIDREREDVRTKLPPMYSVVLHNDDYTPAEVVIVILREAFALNEQASIQAMLRAHNEGKAMIGTFSKDVAESKVAKAMDMAKQLTAKMSTEFNTDVDASSYLFSIEPAA